MWYLFYKEKKMLKKSAAGLSPDLSVVKALKIPRQNVQILWFMSQSELSCATRGKTKLSKVLHLDSNTSALSK